MTQSRRRPVWPFVVVGSVSVLAVLAAVGAWMYFVYRLSDPVPAAFGARVDGKSIVVKMALCPTDVIRRVEVTDADDDKSANPKVLWWASNPTTAAARSGVVKLWSGEGFERHAPELAQSAVPRNLVVGYVDPTGGGLDDVFTLRTVSAAKLKPGQYWTRDGARTAAQIDAQLQCHDSK
ncbi:hypothetical protein O3Q52_37680 [Streptomyces sp. ActVer]|uniref:hypothetical protein n=1 Tax=Streptomyces sp. ActVer TaxID=3014558 RepID=UPI0022B506C5|nr:hypothetical protein [Streptomyces sp. ActVer]MCZ4513775.1 hypothetical protein [Streptomyces sp. ActVer]